MCIRILCSSAFLALASSQLLGQSAIYSHPEAEGIFEHKTVEEAWDAAVAHKRPLLVMFTSNNCAFCKKMVKETYSHPGVKRILHGRTETVMAHSDDYAALIAKLGIRGYPSSLLISPEGEVLDFIEGYVEPKAFAQRVAPLLAEPAQRVGRAETKSSTN